MNRTELIVAVVGRAELSEKDAERAIRTFIDAISEELIKGGEVQLVGFGTFEISERATGEEGNPKTSKTMTIEASKTPEFKTGKALKDEVNK